MMNIINILFIAFSASASSPILQYDARGRHRLSGVRGVAPRGVLVVRDVPGLEGLGPGGLRQRCRRHQEQRHEPHGAMAVNGWRHTTRCAPFPRATSLWSQSPNGHRLHPRPKLDGSSAGLLQIEFGEEPQKSLMACGSTASPALVLREKSTQPKRRFVRRAAPADWPGHEGALTASSSHLEPRSSKQSCRVRFACAIWRRDQDPHRLARIKRKSTPLRCVYC